MNKNEFSKICAQNCGVEQKEMKKILQGIKQTLVDVLNLGQTININGMGKFFVRVRPQRVLTSNLNGKDVCVDQKLSIAFKSSKKLSKEIG